MMPPEPYNKLNAAKPHRHLPPTRETMRRGRLSAIPAFCSDISAPPTVECDQLSDKRTAAESAIEFDPIIV
jgi:hypothetical protein